MKVLIALLLCALMQACCAGKWHGGMSNKKFNDMLRDAANECIREMNRDLRFINEKEPPTDPCIIEDPNMIVCVFKKIGLMKQDGTIDLEHVTSFSETAEERQRALAMFTDKIKECSPTSGGDPCKLVSCFYRLPESLCGRMPNEEDGC